MSITTIDSIERHLCVSHVCRDEEERLHVHVSHYSRPHLASVLDDVLATGHIPRRIEDADDGGLIIVATNDAHVVANDDGNSRPFIAF